MAGKALSVKITGDNKEFDAALRKSAAETKRFAQQQKIQAAQIKKDMEHLKSAVTGVGAALGAAFAGREIFDRFTNSSQATSDNFGRAMDEMKTMADSFFSSVNNNNFNGFLSRLSEVREAARKAFDAEDILADMKLSDTVIDAKTMAQGDKYKADYKEAKAKGDTEGMKKAQAEYSALMNKYWDETRKTQAQTLQTAIANSNKYLSQFGLQASEEDILTYATKTNKEDAGMKGIVEEYNKKIAEFDALINANKLTVQGSYGIAGNQGSASYDTDESKAIEAQKLAYTEENKFAAIQAKLYNEADQGRQHWFSQLADYYKLESGFQQFRAQGSRMEQGVNNISNPKSGQTIKVDSDFGNDIIDTEPEVPVLITPTLDPVSWDKVDDWMHRLETDGILIPINTAIGEAENAPEIKLPKRKDFDGALQGFGAISDMLSNISGLTDNNTSKMLQWAASAASAIGQVISITGILIAVKEAESNANAKAALTGVAASVAATPFLGPVLAMGAVASLTAALLAIPKFATGGIVPGGSFTGDNVLARVNSGEMILNKAQQSNLFNMINSGAGGGRAEQVSFRISGADLVGAIGNYSKKKGKLI